MREYKFKAWLKKEKRMIYVEEINFIYKEVRFKDYNTPFTKPIERNVSFNDVELLQYIGRKDNNDIEIYEDDIIKCYNKIAVIKYGHHNCGCCHSVYGFTFLDNNGVTATPSFGDCEVIGNIYENPELLGDKYETN